MDSSSLSTFAAGLRDTNYLSISSIALLVYDYILTIHLEVQYVWRAPWTVGKVLFFVARYLTFLDVPAAVYLHLGYNLSSNTCFLGYVWASVGLLVGITAAEGLLALRTWAIWDLSERWDIALGCIMTCVWIANAVILGLYCYALRVGPQPDPSIPGCFLTALSRSTPYVFLIMMLYELFVVLATGYRGLQYHWGRRSELTSILYRDALAFSVSLFIVSLFNTVFIFVAPQSIYELFAEFQRVLHAVLCCRIALHLRGAAERVPQRRSAGISNMENVEANDF